MSALEVICRTWRNETLWYVGNCQI